MTYRYLNDANIKIIKITILEKTSSLNITYTNGIMKCVEKMNSSFNR